MATINSYKGYKGHCIICNAVTYRNEVCSQCSSEMNTNYQHDGSIIHAKEPGIPAPVPGFYSRRL